MNIIKLFLITILSGIFISCEKTSISPKGETFNSHLIKTQYYRWFQLYERPMNSQRIENQLDILYQDVVVKSVRSEVKGVDNYKKALSVYKGWKNSHHVESIKIKEKKNGNFHLKATIKYQNIQPNGTKAGYKIKYNATLKKTNSSFLPVFHSLELEPKGKIDEEYKDSYPENRVRSLMHYWLANFENLDGNATPMKEILTPKFHLNLSAKQKPITSIEGLQALFKFASKSLDKSVHYIKNFEVKTIDDNKYEMNVEFKWYGIAKDGSKRTASTKHKWIILDNINDRFAKVQRVDVQLIKGNIR